MRSRRRRAASVPFRSWANLDADWLDYWNNPDDSVVAGPPGRCSQSHRVAVEDFCRIHATPASSPGRRLASIQEGGELEVVREVVCEPPRHVDRVRHVAFPDLHVPQREFGFCVGEEI